MQLSKNYSNGLEKIDNPMIALDISQDRRSVQSRFSENTLAFASSRFEKGINKVA